MEKYKVSELRDYVRRNNLKGVEIYRYNDDNYKRQGYDFVGDMNANINFDELDDNIEMMCDVEQYDLEDYDRFVANTVFSARELWYLDNRPDDCRICMIFLSSAREQVERLDCQIELQKMRQCVAYVLRDARTSRNLSQVELEKLTGIKRSNLCAAEKGRANTTIGTLTRIALALNCHLSVSFVPQGEQKANKK
jgi:DNA-binding phage protein